MPLALIISVASVFAIFFAGSLFFSGKGWGILSAIFSVLGIFYTAKEFHRREIETFKHQHQHEITEYKIKIRRLENRITELQQSKSL